jgi:hypothetical protein
MRRRYRTLPPGMKGPATSMQNTDAAAADRCRPAGLCVAVCAGPNCYASCHWLCCQALNLLLLILLLVLLVRILLLLLPHRAVCGRVRWTQLLRWLPLALLTSAPRSAAVSSSAAVLQGCVWSCALDPTATLAATGSADFSAKICCCCCCCCCCCLAGLCVVVCAGPNRYAGCHRLC